MAHTNAFSDYLAELLANGTGIFFNNANAHIGFGDSNVIYSPSQTKLQAEVNLTSSVRVGMDVGYPMTDPDANGSNNVTRYKVTLGTSVGNFAWNEWGVFNNNTDGTMMTRVVEFLGEKTNKATWVFEVDITFV